MPIDWQGPEDCERGDAVRAKVLRLLGGSQKAVASGTKVTVTVKRDRRSRYVAVLETTTAAGGGTTRLEGESCEAIAAGLAVPVGTVYSRLHAARATFRAAFAELAETPFRSLLASSPSAEGGGAS